MTTKREALRNAREALTTYAVMGKGVWRTIRGRHVFIREGESVQSAMNRSLHSGKGNRRKGFGTGMVDRDFDKTVAAATPGQRRKAANILLGFAREQQNENYMRVPESRGWQNKIRRAAGMVRSGDVRGALAYLDKEGWGGPDGGWLAPLGVGRGAPRRKTDKGGWISGVDQRKLAKSRDAAHRARRADIRRQRKLLG